jgi:tetratricopeptide (TPR) repeat protein
VRQKAASIAGNARMATERTLQALTALMNGLSAIDGRKNVLFFSEGILAEQEWPLVERTIGLAARANARIYTLDARGLDRSQMGDRLAGVDPGGQGGMLEVLKALDEASDSINSLAVDTGGFVIRNQNELTSAVARIAAEASRYYVLGYRSDHTPDGSFRRLAVRVNKPGLVVRARRGYVATPKQAPSPTDAATSTRTTGLDAAAAAAHPEGPAPRPNSGEASREGTDRAGGDRAGPDVSGSATSAAGPEEARRADSSNSLATSPSTSVKTPDARLRPGAATHVERLAPSSASRDADADAGWDAYKRGDLENARRSLGTAAARPSAAPWVHYALGQSAYALRQFADAVSAWETVRRTTPEFEPVYFDLVDGYLQQKDYDKATRVLRDAQKRWPRDADVLNALGVVQVARGSLDDAVDSFERAIGAAPAEAVAYFNLAKAAELRYWKYRRFVTQTRQWIANGNDRTKAIENYKRYLEKGGPLENAARDGLSRLEWNSRQ